MHFLNSNKRFKKILFWGLLLLFALYVFYLFPDIGVILIFLGFPILYGYLIIKMKNLFKRIFNWDDNSTFLYIFIAFAPLMFACLLSLMGIGFGFQGGGKVTFEWLLLIIMMLSLLNGFSFLFINGILLGLHCLGYLAVSKRYSSISTQHKFKLQGYVAVAFIIFSVLIAWIGGILIGVNLLAVLIDFFSFYYQKLGHRKIVN